jgi:hypothetical protein
VYKVTTYFSLTVKRRGIFLLAGLGFTHNWSSIVGNVFTFSFDWHALTESLSNLKSIMESLTG